MPRNGSGTYSLPESAFVAGTTIQSAPVNNDFSDIASALTGSLAADGQTSMTGAIKGATGTLGAPSYTFASDLNTGFFLSGTDEVTLVLASVAKVVFTTAGVAVVSGLSVAGDVNVLGSAGFAVDVGIGGNAEILGRALVGNGSVTAPTHGFGNSLGVGFYISGTNVMHAVVASVSAFSVRASSTASFHANVSVASSLEVGGRLVVTGSIVPTVNMPGRVLAIIEDNKAQNTAAQTLTGGADTVRELNTLVFNLGTSVGLASNQFTLQAGTWEITWESPVSVPSNADNNSQSFLYNATAASEVKRGGSVGWLDGNGDGGAPILFSNGCTVVTIAASAAFEIRHRTSGNTPGGRPANLSTEVYTRVMVRYA
jgi:hypothetical protein